MAARERSGLRLFSATCPLAAVGHAPAAALPSYLHAVVCITGLVDQHLCREASRQGARVAAILGTRGTPGWVGLVSARLESSAASTPGKFDRFTHRAPHSGRSCTGMQGRASGRHQHGEGRALPWNWMAPRPALLPAPSPHPARVEGALSSRPLAYLQGGRQRFSRRQCSAQD